MEASILDLRYKMKDVLSALSRNEKVKILYHGKLKGIISPCQERITLKVIEHPFFGMNREEKQSVEEQMNELRGDRYHDV